MGQTCRWLPKNGKKTFQELNKNFGRSTAVTLFNAITSDTFINTYQQQLEFEDGVPTYESIIKIPLIRKYLGKEKLVNNLQSQFPHLEDNISNVEILINKAKDFNDNNPENKDFVAFVDYDEEGKITVKVESRNSSTEEIAINQYKIYKLNQVAAKILGKANISIEDLSQIETAIGRVGVTEFKHLSNVLDEFVAVIRLANNLEGFNALSEELSHILIGVNLDQPLVQRSINFLRKKENASQVLGQEFDKIYEFYEGNMDLVAEEAAGKLLRQALLDRMENKRPQTPSIIQRMANFIVNLFKGINPAYYQDSLNNIKYEYSKFAEEILSSKRELKKSDIQNAKREAEFNAFSERVEVQIKALRKISTILRKSASLLKDIEKNPKKVKSPYITLIRSAQNLEDIIRRTQENGESMKAIANTVELCSASVSEVLQSIIHIQTLPQKERFKLLENCSVIIQQNKRVISELQQVLGQEYLNDSEVATQQFMLDDIADALAEYRNSSEVEKVDTSGKTPEQIVKLMQEESEKWELASDETHYVNKDTNEKSFRVTSVIHTTADSVLKMAENNPYKIPSTNIGTGMDILVRDFFSDKIVYDKGSSSWKVNGKNLDEVYPNANREDLNKFADQLQNFKNILKRRKITIVPNDIKAIGTVDTIDGAGNIHKVNVTGTLDLLGYDSKGNWYIFDMKTHRADFISEEHLEDYRRQLTLYKKFLEEKYGIKIKEINIIPIKVSYPKPLGAGNGASTYEVSDSEVPEGYSGEQNQLLRNGREFKEAKPFLGKIIRNLQDLETEIDYAKLTEDPTKGLGNGLQVINEAIAALNAQTGALEGEYYKLAKPEFIKFLETWMGSKTVEVADPDNPGRFKTITIEELVNNMDVDLDWADKMLATMADTPDTLLQILDSIIKKVKHEKRLSMIDLEQKITALGLKYERLGIKNYDFMFEENKQEYINTEFSRTAYNKAYKEFLQYLQKKYGTTKIGTEEHKQKQQELINWVEENTEFIYLDGKGLNVPRKDLYPSKFDSLSEAQKDFYQEWMEIKRNIDMLLGPNKTHLTNSIKIRKSTIERAREMAQGDVISNVKGKLSEIFEKSYDDETSYAKGLRDLQGRELRVLPLKYLSAPEGYDISTDVISTLIAYADMAYNYHGMSEIVDALEVGKAVMLDPNTQRKIGIRRKGKPLMEILRRGTEDTAEAATIDAVTSNFGQALENMLDSKVYEKYNKSDSEVMGVDANKVTSLTLKIGASIQLGFNIMANIANLVSGIGMTNIEAFTGEYFRPKTLSRADKIYLSNLKGMAGDIGSRVKFNKLSLIKEKYDMKLNFQKNIRNKNFVNRNLLTRIFGPSIQFVGQTLGDDWLYTRVGLSLLLEAGIELNGKPIENIEDIYDMVPVDENNLSAGNKIVLKEGVTINGREFTEEDEIELSGNIWDLNKHLFGVYNTEDTIEARRYILGKFGMQYRDWMPPLLRHRFGKATTSIEGKIKTKEGFYRTTSRYLANVLKDLKHGQVAIMSEWRNLDESEQKNVIRAIVETGQLLTISIIASILKSGGAERRRFLRRFFAAIFTRGVTELGALHPIGVFFEGKKILKSPLAVVSLIDRLQGLIEALWIPNWFEPVSAGKYKDMSKGARGLLKSPLSLYYSSIYKIIHPEEVEKYYDNNSSSNF